MELTVNAWGPALPVQARPARLAAGRVAPLDASTAAPLTADGLFREHAHTVARWAARLGGPQIDVLDVVQEVFLVVHRKLSQFRPDAKVTTWLYQITETVVRHQRRRWRWRGFLRGSADDAAARLPDPGPLALEQLERSAARATVYAALDRLSERQRTVIVLFELEGLSGEDIAERLGAKVGTVWVWLHRARQAFLEQLTLLEAADG